MVLGMPVAYFVVDQWLATFPYRVDIAWWIFLGAGLSALLVAVGTVSVQAVRAAVADPVKSLRYE